MCKEKTPGELLAEELFYRRGAQCAPMSLPVRSARYLAATQDRKSTQRAAQGELPKGQERVLWRMAVPPNDLVGCCARHRCL